MVAYQKYKLVIERKSSKPKPEKLVRVNYDPTVGPVPNWDFKTIDWKEAAAFSQRLRAAAAQRPPPPVHTYTAENWERYLERFGRRGKLRDLDPQPPIRSQTTQIVRMILDD